MSFVDGRVIRQRMAKKDARMAKKLAKTHGKMAVKQTGRHEASPSCPAVDAASPQSTDEVPMTPKPDPSTTPPVRTDNRVASVPPLRRTVARPSDDNGRPYELLSCGHVFVPYERVGYQAVRRFCKDCVLEGIANTEAVR